MRRREFIVLVGGVAAWPLVGRAQQRAMPVIGYLHFAGPTYPMTAPFLQGLGETGYVDGKNVAVEYRWAEDRYDRLPVLAADLVSRKVDLIAAMGPPSALAAKNATSAIPIVFLIGTDPIEEGLVTSYVNGHRYTGNPRTIPLTDHTSIQLDVGQDVPPLPYRFPSGG